MLDAGDTAVEVNASVLRFVGPGQVEWQPHAGLDRPLAEREVLIRTLCSLVSPGTELQANYLRGRFPSVGGYANVAEVLAVGGEVTEVAVGQRIFSYAPHASHWIVPAEAVLPVPAELAPEVATLVRLLQVPMTTLVTTRARPGDLVLVSGCGPVGYLAAEVFRLTGYQITVIEPHDGRRAAAGRAGHRVLPAFPLGEAEYQDRVALVVDCSGHEQAVLDGLQIARRHGEVVMIGAPWRRRTDHTAHELLAPIFHRYVTLRTGWEWELPREPHLGQPHSIRQNLQTALGWLGDGRIALEGQITRHDPRDCQEVYQGHLRQAHDALFTVFDWRLLD